jgi:hypothetical protein
MPCMQSGIHALGYHAMRLRWCGAALAAFLRRWAVHLVVACAVLGAGTTSFVAAVVAAAAWLVLPLFYAAVHGPWLILATLVQSLFGAACVWGLRTWLWRPRWAEAERALPITQRARLVSDLVVVALALLPLILLFALGAASVLAHDPAWLRPHRIRALAALASAVALSVALGVRILRGMRRQPRWPGPMPAAARGVDPPADTLLSGFPLHWPRALLWQPLWRGPARRSGRALWLGSLVLLAPALAMWGWRGAASWWLAAFALLMLLVVTRVNALAREEFAGLIESCADLPLAPSVLHRARSAMALLPLLPSVPLLVAGLPLAQVRPGVLAAYAAACLASAVAEVFAAPTTAADKSSRWLFSLVVCVALASEVIA